jgi:hypothetical protein
MNWVDEVIKMCRNNTIKLEYYFYNNNIQDTINRSPRPTYIKEYKFTSFELSRDKESVRVFYGDIDLRFNNCNDFVSAYIADEEVFCIYTLGASQKMEDRLLNIENSLKSSIRVNKKCHKGVMNVSLPFLLEEWDALTSIAKRMKLSNKSFFKELCSSIEMGGVCDERCEEENDKWDSPPFDGFIL